MNAFMNYCFCKLLSLRRDNDGFVVMFTLALFLLLFVFCASVYAVAETIHQRIRLQNACDAAAYSAAVVQADGLSRMATVNQALAWTYVQMTNHQMDYITYRWLRLTVKRYDEDKANAEGYHAYLVANFNKDYGIYAFILCAGELAITRILGHDLRCNQGHAENLLEVFPELYPTKFCGWWAGQGPRKQNILKLNGHPIFSDPIHRNTIFELLSQLDSAAPSNTGSTGSNNGSGNAGSTGSSNGSGNVGSTGNNNGTGSNGSPDSADVGGTYGWVSIPENQILRELLKNEEDPEDLYGLEAALRKDSKDIPSEKELLDRLDRWYSASQNKINDYVDSRYQEQIDSESDPQEKERLENARETSKNTLHTALSEIYDVAKRDIPDIAEQKKKIKEIMDKYQAQRDALPVPDENDPDYTRKYDEYIEQIQKIEEKEAEEIDALLSTSSVSTKSNALTPLSLSTTMMPYVPASLPLSSSNGAWGENMRDAIIKGDKTTISQLNSCHAVINQTMEETMKTVAEFVLVQMLRDPRLPDEDALKKYYSYIYIPKGFDPYSAGSGETDDQEQIKAETQAEAVSNIFAPLYNTEPYERILLQYATAAYSDQPLYACFPVADTQNSKSKGWGLDQWFIRTGTVEDNGVRQRTEGALGIQRGYKDTNLNETNAGVIALSKKIDRGNHIMNLYLDGVSGVADVPENSGKGISSSLLNNINNGNDLFASFLQMLIGQILGSFLEGLADELFDITASCGNAHNEQTFIPMCSSVDESVSLYSEYEWSSAKWVCLAKPQLGLLFIEYKLCGKNKEVICDFGAKRNHKGKWCRKLHVKHEGFGHYHIPKWFCGMYPRFLGDNGSMSKTDKMVQIPLLDLQPPITGSIDKDGRHGYMESTSTVGDAMQPVKGAFKGKESSMSREDYRSCVPFIDGMLVNRLNFFTGGYPGLINGHARIYGDDEEVWEANTYVGEVAKPWVLSENFFSGAGTIVVGVAMKHENPFVQMLTMLQQDGGMINGKSVLSAFDPPSYKGLKVNGDRISAGNCIWTMSAARAGVRRTRRNGAFDQERMYQVTYDPTSDPENMFYFAKNEPYLYKDGGWVKYESGDTTHKAVCVLGGCICSPSDENDKDKDSRWKQISKEELLEQKQTNKEQLQFVWNLCETDWDAILLPLRYAGVGAQLSGLSNEATYQERREKIENMDLQNAPGDGKNWTWAPASTNTSAGNENPMNPGSGSTTGWAPLDSSNTDNVKLESLLPDGEKKLNLEMLLRQNRIL